MPNYEIPCQDQTDPDCKKTISISLPFKGLDDNQLSDLCEKGEVELRDDQIENEDDLTPDEQDNIRSEGHGVHERHISCVCDHCGKSG